MKGIGKNIMFEIKFPIKNGHATHMPLLKYMFEDKKLINSGGLVIEIGCGEYSSLFFNYIQKNMNLKILSFENDMEWYRKIASKYETENYKFHCVKDWNQLIPDVFDDETFFDLIFIDHSPWESRIEKAIQFKDKAKYILIHDYDYYLGENDELNQKIVENFKYNCLYAHINPPTLLLSNFVEVGFDGIEWGEKYD